MKPSCRSLLEPHLQLVNEIIFSQTFVSVSSPPWFRLSLFFNLNWFQVISVILSKGIFIKFFQTIFHGDVILLHLNLMKLIPASLLDLSTSKCLDFSSQCLFFVILDTEEKHVVLGLSTSYWGSGTVNGIFQPTDFSLPCNYIYQLWG